MLQFPLGSRFVVITDLKLTDATNRRSPGEPADDLALVDEWIEIHLMLLGPMVGGRGRENGSLVGHVGVLEGELSHTTLGKPLDVAPYQRLAVDVPARHDASGAHGQASG